MSDLTTSSAVAGDAAGSAPAAPAAVTGTAPAPAAPAAAETGPSNAELAQQLAALASAVQSLAANQPAAAPAEPAPATATVHLTADEVPPVGTAIAYKGRRGIVLEVLESTREDGKGNAWTQYQVQIGLFREAHLVDAEQIERI